ncbi:hypothetical protein PU634_11505 [Oceanimonas pelagia]|uniref:DUF2946 domain-containing protein n=1 Tax=Oceanimonas pelagia TaxID=3028314 RepID=A0AA50KMP6_9GAMM|nr:hypothetical protein [Oceanimonas pelagia]WMC09737.1 hypothetical protein PU634_11505 [Oceanimonas pelagia]
MAGAGLSRARLAIVLVLLVGVICLGQRTGLVSHCGQQSGEVLTVAQSDDAGQLHQGGSCSLSEQLLTKFWDHPDSLLLGLLALLSWWLAPPRRHSRHPMPPPEPVPEYRRHLLLCVFRE